MDLAAALPNPAAGASKRARKLAGKLTRKLQTGSGALSRAYDSCGRKQGLLLKRAQKSLRGLLTAARAASGKGTLGVPLPSIEAAVDRLLNLAGELIAGVIPSGCEEEGEGELRR